MSQGFTHQLTVPLPIAQGGTGSITGLPYSGITQVAWTAFTPTLTGFASTTNNVGRYVRMGNMITVQLEINGTSNATGFSVTNLPATSAIVSTITVCNQSATPTAFRISIAPAGAADTASQYIYYDVAIGGNDTFACTFGISLATTDKIRVYNTLATLSFTVTGVEIS